MIKKLINMICLYMLKYTSIDEMKNRLNMIIYEKLLRALHGIYNFFLFCKKNILTNYFIFEISIFLLGPIAQLG